VRFKVDQECPWQRCLRKNHDEASPTRGSSVTIKPSSPTTGPKRQD
jgi:hypothetical protein